MYIKIKNPTHWVLLRKLAPSLFALGVTFLLIIFGFGSVTGGWKIVVEFFGHSKQGIIAIGYWVFGLLVILIGIIAGLIGWWKKRTQWNAPTAVYALDFGPEGVTVYTRQNTQFLLCKETDFKIMGELMTVPIVGYDHGQTDAGLHALTLTFLSQGYCIEVSHKLFTPKLLYQLADLHTRFKSFTFDCKLSSSNDKEQQKLAAFLKEQIQNQMRYGLHRRYRDYPVVIGFNVLFVAVGIVAFWVAFSFSASPFKSFVGWILLLVGVGLCASSIILLCDVIKDKRTSCKIERLRGK